ncbi:universal stress protein [Candidatus Parvarchaeota archaeon]|nr:universal stress protein [Candidatus Parvarchaeota archaeon]
MIKSQKVVIGFDGSEYSKKAVEYTINNFDKKSAIYLVYVEEMLAPLYLSNPSLFIDDSVIKKIREKTKKELQHQVEIIKKKGFKAQYEYIEGYPPNQIINEAKRKNADIIVVGSRGMGKWKGSVLGSVSQALTVISKIPLLIIK